MPFVLDNSVVCGWIFENQTTDYTESIAQRLLDDRAAVPVLWPMELANVLRTACRRGGLIARQAHAIVSTVADLPIEVDTRPPSASALLSLALRHDLSAYDAAYLELALHLQQPIATQDHALAEAARAAGVGVLD